MATFFAVLLGIVVVILMCALLAWPMVMFMAGGEFGFGWKIRTRVLHSVASIVLLAVIIAILINSGIFSSSGAEHCGPGTRYVSESHYNPATKTTITDWMCIA